MLSRPAPGSSGLVSGHQGGEPFVTYLDRCGSAHQRSHIGRIWKQDQQRKPPVLVSPGPAPLFQDQPGSSPKTEQVLAFDISIEHHLDEDRLIEMYSSKELTEYELCRLLQRCP